MDTKDKIRTEELNVSPLNWILSQVKGDFVVWFIVLALSLVSVLAIYSSTKSLAYKEQAGNTEFFVLKHAFLLFVGLGLMFFCHKVHYKYYYNLSVLIWIVSIPLLLYTLVKGLDRNEASRWIMLPIVNLTFQTSDLAKLALIAMTARALSRRQSIISDFKKGVRPILIPILVTVGLIAPANLSTAMLLFATSLVLMYVGRVPLKHIALIAFVIVGSGVLLIGTGYALEKQFNIKIARVSTWVGRVDRFVNKQENIEDINDQTKYAKVAIATGGFFGKGPGNSIQKNYLPNPYADFIFAIIIEEYGLIGGLLIMLAYLILLYRSIRIVMKSPKAFGALLGFGLTLSIVLQAFINMGVAVDLFPVTGLPLPLVSMGGTSLLFSSIALGIILSVTRNIEERENLNNLITLTK